MADNEIINDGFTLAIGTVQNWSQAFFERLPNIIVGCFILVLLGFVAYVISILVLKYFERKGRKDLGRILADLTFWGLIGFSILLSLTIIIPSIRPVDMLASLGIGSLAFGFAFKDILQNWLSGLLILVRMPFRRGDQIKLEQSEGTVLRIEPRATIIRSYDGRDIVVPNTTIYNSIIKIHTSQEQRRVEIDLTVGYAYDIRKITKIIENSILQVDEILQDPPPQILCWALGSTSLEMKVRWWINSERSQEVVSRSRAIQAIKEAFDANEIDPTDPQLIYYQNTNNAPPLDEEMDIVQNSQITNVNAGPPPPQMKISANDPEADTPKADSKEQTLLLEE